MEQAIKGTDGPFSFPGSSPTDQRHTKFLYGMGPLSVKYWGFVHAELHADKAAFSTHRLYIESAKMTWGRQKKQTLHHFLITVITLLCTAR